MIWADRIAQELKGKPQHVDDMKTASGYIHVGSLRGPLLHDVMYKALKANGEKHIFTYVFNDFDPIDGLSDELKKDFTKYMGYPLRLAPSPDGKARSFADFFADDFKKVLNELGCEAIYLSSWDMYREGKFNTVIKEALDNAEKIQDIYKKISGSQKKEQGWFPFQVICPKCKKIGTNKVTAWDGKKVTYSCEKNLVTWAVGCGHTGKISPFDGTGKLAWKVDWPAHWKVLGITFEGAGKDHASKGGSYDIAFALCEEVFHYTKPYYFPYEHFLLGGRKMSTSKGVGLKAHDLTTIMPPELGRFLMVRTLPNRALEFDPSGNSIPDLFDEFDRCAKAYWDKTDTNLGRIFELSQVNNLYQNKVFLPGFKEIIDLAHLPFNKVSQIFENSKGSTLKFEELKIIRQRLNYANVWIGKFGPPELKRKISETISNEAFMLNDNQKKYLLSIPKLFTGYKNPDDLQIQLYKQARIQGLEPKKAFSAIYYALIGKPFGPKAAQLLLSLNPEEIVKRFQQVSVSENLTNDHKSYLYKDLHKSDLFDINSKVSAKFPSITVGIAVIKGVSIKKEDIKLKEEIDFFLKSLFGLTTQNINTYPEVLSYKKIYKETGIDWHSRRPSPEALLRRIALGKGLYSVNTCVDAYNMIVMKNRVSIGAFDLDKIKFPTILRFAKKGEKIHLLGDSQPSEYEDGELAYFDNEGGINIDFNYRDTQRTMVTQDTKNLWINIEGVYDITREQVEQSMKETIEIIQKYCGGKVELVGVTTAN